MGKLGRKALHTMYLPLISLGLSYFIKMTLVAGPGPLNRPVYAVLDATTFSWPLWLIGRLF
jgi:hypothetical protein